MFDTLMKIRVSYLNDPEFWKTSFGLSNELSEKLKFSNSSMYIDKHFLDAFKMVFGKDDTVQFGLNYTAYFEACHPRECTYFKQVYRSWIEVITVIAGLIGGLNVVLTRMVNWTFGCCCAVKPSDQKYTAPKKRNKTKSRTIESISHDTDGDGDAVWQ